MDLRNSARERQDTEKINTHYSIYKLQYIYIRIHQGGR